MENLEEKFEKFETHHKIATFILILVVTILIVRLSVFFHDPNPILMGFELHHFDYGLAILILINIFLVLGKKRTTIYLPLLAIAVGLILDDIAYIRMNINNANTYAQSLSSVPIIFGAIVITTLIIILIFKTGKRQ
jgi:hypothetical protein